MISKHVPVAVFVLKQIICAKELHKNVSRSSRIHQDLNWAFIFMKPMQQSINLNKGKTNIRPRG